MLPHKRENHETHLVSVLLGMHLISNNYIGNGPAGELDSSFSAFNDHEGTTVSSKSVPINANLE